MRGYARTDHPEAIDQYTLLTQLSGVKLPLADRARSWKFARRQDVGKPFARATGSFLTPPLGEAVTSEPVSE
ncbi:MAG: hypothetical protein WBW31_05850, partial [Candidatus Sulfotelmatobacter sp.]